MNKSPTNRTRVVSSVYLRSGRDVLLVHHKRFDEWVPVGGGREGDETPAETALRELAEETGIVDAIFINTGHINPPGQPIGYLGYSEHRLGEVIHLNHNFLMLTSNAVIKRSDEHHDVGWFRMDRTPNAVYNKMPPNVRYFFRLALAVLL